MLLVTLSSVLFVLLLLQTIGVVWFVCKVQNSRKNIIKKDVNPLYGVDDEMEVADGSQRRSADQNYDNMGS